MPEHIDESRQSATFAFNQSDAHNNSFHSSDQKKQKKKHKDNSLKDKLIIMQSEQLKMLQS